MGGEEDLLHLEDDVVAHREAIFNEGGLANYGEDNQSSFKEQSDVSLNDVSQLLVKMATSKEKKDMAEIWDPCDVLMEEIIDHFNNHVLGKTIQNNFFKVNEIRSSFLQHYTPRKVSFDPSSLLNASFSSADSSEDNSERECS